MEKRLTSSQNGDKYMKLKELSSYSGISVRKLRELLKDPDWPIPHFRMYSGMILVKRSEFDEWMTTNFRWTENEMDQIVNEVMEEFH